MCYTGPMTIKHTNQPLWMPKGSIRSILALAVVFGGVAAAFVDLEAADRLLPAAGVVFGFYFKERAEE